MFGILHFSWNYKIHKKMYMYHIKSNYGNFDSYHSLSDIGFGNWNFKWINWHWRRCIDYTSTRLFFGFSQHSAQGTTLALMVSPISLLGAWAYYQQGYVDLKVTIFVCVGFFLGAFLGAKFAIGIPEVFLRRIFGTALLFIAFKMIFTKS
jgi:hypothetical protein